MIKFGPVILFACLALIAAVVHLALRADEGVDPARQLWASATPWSPTSFEHEQAQQYLSFEESLVLLQNEQWLEEQVPRFNLDSPEEAHELDVLAMRVATIKEIFGAKNRAYEAGDVGRVEQAFYRPVVGADFALACSKFGDLGAILFRIDREREPAAYEALRALSDLAGLRPK